MAWTDTGLIWYAGERPINRTPQLQASQDQVKQANPPETFVKELSQAYLPHQTTRTQHTGKEIAAAYAQMHGIPIALTAAGDIREQPSHFEDARLCRARQGRAPTSKEQLDQWLKASDATLAAEQRMGLTMQYEAAHGVLPSVGQESASTKPHTLGSLGLRRATRLTQAQFAERLKYHGVPQDQHMKLALAAYEGGHIVPDDEDDQAHTFHPGTNMAMQKTVAGIHANFVALDVLQGKKRAGGVRVSDMRASARHWEC
jgi:hypothetical protein